MYAILRTDSKKREDSKIVTFLPLLRCRHYNQDTVFREAK